MPLLQNQRLVLPLGLRLFDYQSECHCSKTDDGVPYEDIESRIKYESEKLRIKEVLVVDRNGAVRRYKNS